LVSSSGDKKLVLNINKMLAVSDDLAVCVLNRVLRLLAMLGPTVLVEASADYEPLFVGTYFSGDVVAPFCRTPSDLAIYAPSLGCMLSVRLLESLVLAMSVLTLHLVVTFVHATIDLLSQTTAMAKQASLSTLAIASKTTLIVVFTFEAPLLWRWIHATLLGTTACLW
jgi:hypothetical protein